jgi:hypothetical protein
MPLAMTSTTDSAPAVWRAPRLYLLVPRELAGRLHGPLRAFYAEDPDVEVIVDRRAQERRQEGERRAEEPSAPGLQERRQLVRRFAPRRAPQLVRTAPVELPRSAWPYADRLTFVQRMEPVHRSGEQVEAVAALARAVAGDAAAYGEVYWLFYDRVFGRLRILVNDTRAAEELADRTFSRAFDEIATYRPASASFEEWLAGHARELAAEHLRGHRRKVA